MSANPRNRPVFAMPAVSGTAAPLPDAGASGDYLSIDAAHATRKTSAGAAAWKVIAGLGRSGESIGLLPTTAPVPDSATLEYSFSTAKAGPANVLVYCIPTHALYPGVGLRYSASIDGEPPKIADIDTAEMSPAWKTNVLRAAAIGTTAHSIAAPGRHTLILHPLDPGLVFDKIVIDLGGLKPTQSGPPETAATP
jgi:hypothetical protein